MTIKYFFRHYPKQQDFTIKHTKKMKILDMNSKFILTLSNMRQVFLIDSTTLQVLHVKQFLKEQRIKSGSLQYGTGIAALAINTIAFIYDFTYQRQLYTLETYKSILQICIRKNLLIVVSDDRIIIHNLDKKENQCYIPILDGKLVFLDQSYLTLSIFYPEDHSVLVSKPVWSRNTFKITNGVKYQKGCYFDSTKKTVLSLQNTLSFYEESQLIKVYGFDFSIVQVKSTQNPKLVLVLLENNEIIAQNLSQQFNFDFEELLDNELVALEDLSEDKKQKYSNFWIVNDQVYLWVKPQNQVGKLFRAKVSQMRKLIKTNEFQVKFPSSPKSQSKKQEQLHETSPLKVQQSINLPN